MISDKLKEVILKSSITTILNEIGEDINREGLLKTPERVLKSYSEIYAGYKQNPKDIFTTFESEGYDQIILLKSFEFFSTCEHHMLSFFGKAHVAYIPNKKIIGISKLARLVDIYAKRLQIQERIGQQVTNDLMTYLEPKGAACILEATHLCMRMRGVEKQNSIMTTSSLTGVFLQDQSAKNELIQLIKL
jgi:GTP cyclohydrolase I